MWLLGSSQGKTNGMGLECLCCWCNMLHPEVCRCTVTIENKKQLKYRIKVILCHSSSSDSSSSCSSTFLSFKSKCRNKISLDAIPSPSNGMLHLADESRLLLPKLWFSPRNTANWSNSTGVGVSPVVNLLWQLLEVVWNQLWQHLTWHRSA